MSLLSLENVAVTYRDRPILAGVSFLVEAGDRVGLVGPNGCGKSTLLRVLAGVEVPDLGTRTVRRDLAVGWLDQDPVLPADTRVRDVVRAGLAGREAVVAELDEVHARLAAAADPRELERLLARQGALEDRLATLGGHDVEHRVESTIHALGLRDPDASCGALSGGERRRVALARLLLSGPELLLLDEPTNHLDAEVVAWFEDRLAETSAAFVLVTHDRYFLDRVVDRVVEIERAALHEYRGGYAGFLEGRADRLEREGKAEATRVNLLRRETEWMKRGPPARTTKAKARIGRYEALVAAAPDAAAAELAFRIPIATRLGDRVFAVRGVSKAFDGRTVLDRVDLELGRGERLGVVGPNGAGKTTLLRICMGLLAPDAGTVEVGPTVRFSFIDQRREDLRDGNTVVEEIGGGNDWVDVGGRKLRVESFLESFLFPSAMMRTRIGDLSGGERNRVLMAKLLSRGGNVVVLDEPTNDLDLMTLRVLEEALCAFEGSVVVVSHDRWFLDRVATRILHLGGDGTARPWAGDVTGLLARLAEEGEATAERAAVADKAKGRTPPPPAAPPAKLSTRERRELEELPDKITAAEAELAAVDARLADPSLYAGDRAAAQGVVAERGAVEARLRDLYARWEELESRPGA
jgi:ATP-binding cassette subfamily F protein uup